MTPRTARRRAPTESSRSTGRWVLWLLGLAIAAFAVGYLITAVLFFRGAAGDDIVTVPDLRWRTEAEAQRMAEQTDLSVEVGASLTNPEVPEGQILAQTPLPGEEVVPGSVVRVVLSAGPERQTIPEVTVLSGQQAQELLLRYGFQVTLEEQTSDEPAGRVIAVSPSPGSQVELPATVRLVVSTGPPFTEVPELYGMTVEDARTVLQMEGLRLGNVEYDPFSGGPAGRVIGQWPAGGDQARSGTVVSLTVAGSRAGNP